MVICVINTSGYIHCCVFCFASLNTIWLGSFMTEWYTFIVGVSRDSLGVTNEFCKLLVYELHLGFSFGLAVVCLPGC